MGFEIISDKNKTADWVRRARELMVSRGIKTDKDLAIEAGISGGSLSQSMRNLHLPKITTLDKIAKALGTTSQYLIYGDEQRMAVSLPLLFSAGEILKWLDVGSQAFDGLLYHDVDPGLPVSHDGFAWRVDQTDMAPALQVDDVVIIEPRDMDDPGLLRRKNPPYLLVAQWADDGPITTLLGQSCVTGDGVFLVSENEKIPPVKLDNRRHRLLGLVVQLCRTFE